MRTAIFLLALISTTMSAQAKDVDGEFAVFSVGGETCLDYLRARSVPGQAQQRYSEWIQGYLSAFNLIVPNTYNILGSRGFDQAVAWLDEHCNENRESRFVNAAAQLTVNLFPSRINLGPDKDNRSKWSDKVSQN